MNTFKWVKVNREELNRLPRHEEIAGVLVDVYFSPYDLPDKVGGGYDEARNRFVIRFHYSNADETLIRERSNEHIGLGVGKNSRRLYEVEIDVNSIGAKEVRLNLDEVDNAIKKLSEKRSDTKDGNIPTDNYLAVSGALKQSRRQLEQQLSLVGN